MASLTVAVYTPVAASSPVASAVDCAGTVLHTNVWAPVPPTPTAVAVPLATLLHNASVLVLVAVTDVGSVIVMDEVAVHPLTSDAVTEKLPSHIAVATPVVCPLDHT